MEQVRCAHAPGSSRRTPLPDETRANYITPAIGFGRALHNGAYPAPRFRAQSRPELQPAPRMPNTSSRFFSCAPVYALFARELNAMAPVLSGIYGNFGLFLRAHAAAPAMLPPHLLGKMFNLTLAESQFDGDARCTPAQLPFANETFKLLIAQHVFEQIDRPDECAAELARVLAPEGVALILGFNPAGSWRPWLTLNAARGAPRLRLRSANAWQQMLAREQIDTLQVRYPGTLWPRAEPRRSQPAESALFATLLGRIGSSWLLLARKRRSTLTPLRLRSTPRELALSPRLAPGARRACA
jgi:SAM-dependent methyltransferase